MAISAIATASLFTFGISALAQESSPITPTRNLIVMVSDGTSGGLLGLSRWYQQYLEPREDLQSLAIDPYICGLVRVHSSDAPMPESSGSMSAYMTGVLQQGRNISIYPQANPSQDLVKVDPEREFQPLATLAEAARTEQGKSVGAVVTCTFYHATPAATTSHSVERGNSHDIARQMASQGLDVMFGGGAKMMDEDMREILSREGITYYDCDMEGFRSHEKGKVWALFNRYHLSYEIDRDTLAEPSLTEMTRKAIELLNQNENGFFLMVEGSKVDMAAHSKDAVGTVTEFLEFNRAFQAAVDFARKDGNTTVIAVADHGTSGIQMGDANFRGYTKAPLDSIFHNFSRFRASGVKMDQMIRECDTSEVRDIFRKWTGIELTKDEYNAILRQRGVEVEDYMSVSLEPNLSLQINNIMTSRTHIGFVSGNHTGEDVYLAVYNPRGQRPEGLVRNIALNRYMQSVMGLPEPLDSLTQKLFIPHEKLLDGFSYSIADSHDGPSLTVRTKKGSVTIHSNRSYAEVSSKDGAVREVPLGSVAVYIKENGKFYLPASLKGLLQE